jgi:hypothetical protein
LRRNGNNGFVDLPSVVRVKQTSEENEANASHSPRSLLELRSSGDNAENASTGATAPSAYTAASGAGNGGAQEKQDAQWFFLSFNYMNNRVLETWHDQTGAALAVFDIRYRDGRLSYLSETQQTGQTWREEMSFDNEGNVTQVDTTEAVRSTGTSSARTDTVERTTTTYTASWTALKPRFVSNGGALALQWDGRGLLTAVAPATNGAPAASWRYAYTLNRRGDWTERRGTVMSSTFGVEAESSVTTYTRTIRYE